MLKHLSNMKIISKKNVIFILKASISILILFIIITNINWGEVSKNLKYANYFLLSIALVFNIFERVELTYKWNLLIWARGIKVSFTRLFFINLIGAFGGLFLPSSLGTDVVRSFYLAKNNSEKSISISSVFVDRIIGLFSLILLGVLSLFFSSDLVPNTNIKFYAIFLFIILLFIFYFFQKRETAFYLKKLLGKIKNRKIPDAINKLHFSILDYKKYPKTLLFSFIITLLVQITRVLTYYFIALSFNISVPIVYFFIFIPIIMLVIMIPISIGGFGVREGTFIAFFALVGMSMNDAVIIAFTNSLINTLVSSLGGVAYLFYNSSMNIPAQKIQEENNFKSTTNIERKN